VSRFERPRRTSNLLDSGSSRAWRRLRRWILLRDLWTCGYCGVQLTPEPGLANSATVDHRLARWEGGSDSPDNLVACCAECQKRGERFFKRESSRDASVRPISLPRPVLGDYTRTPAETRGRRPAAVGSSAAAEDAPPEVHARSSDNRFRADATSARGSAIPKRGPAGRPVALSGGSVANLETKR